MKWALKKCVAMGAMIAAGFSFPGLAGAQEQREESAPTLQLVNVDESFTLPPPDNALAGPTNAPTSVAFAIPFNDEKRDDALRLEAELAKRRMINRELIFQGLNIVDTVQTISCLKRNTCHEMNPILGPDPSMAKLIAFKAGGGALHFLGTHLLNKHAPEAVGAWQITSIAVQGGVVAWNMQFVF